MLRNTVFILFCTLLAACGGGNDRPRGAHCPKTGTTAEGGQPMGLEEGSRDAAAYGEGGYVPFEMEQAPRETAAMAESAPVATVTVHDSNKVFREKLAAIFRDEARGDINVLSISAGGELGAFGAGFLNGLAAREGSRTQYDIVTGVSTGSLIAPLIFLGRNEDLEKLRDEYTTVTEKDLISKRNTMALLFSNSLYTTDKLRKKIKEVISEGFVEELGKIARGEGQKKRVLAVMAVNLDSGQPEIFDLTAIAGGEGKYASFTEAQKRQRIIDAVTASSAIPIGFPPVFIDGNMYVDGGARQHVFVGAEMSVAAARERSAPRRLGHGVESYRLSLSGPGEGRSFKLFVLVNGDYRISTDCTGNAITGIAGRTFSVTVNQMLYDSVFRLLSMAKLQGWETHVTDARLAAAPPAATADPAGRCVRSESGDFFNRPFMQCLYKKACKEALESADPWVKDLAGLPTRLSVAAAESRADESIPEQCRLKPDTS